MDQTNQRWKLQLQRSSPRYAELKGKYGGWLVHDLMPFGENAGQLIWQMDYTKLEEADPNELNDLVYMHCKDPNLLIYGLSAKNQWKFLPFLESMSYSSNTVIFYGDAFNEDILNMAEKRILYIRSGIRLADRWYETMVESRDQWVFEIGGNEDMTYMMNTMGVVGVHPFTFAIPRWDPPDDADSIEMSKYLYRYLAHAMRMIVAIERTGIGVRIGLDLNRLLDTGYKGDPDHLRGKKAEMSLKDYTDEYQSDPHV